MRAALACLLPVLTAACPQDRAPVAPPPESPQLARDEVLVQINERASKIVDFDVRGRRCLERCAQDEAVTQAFRVQVRAPGLFRLEVPSVGLTTTFDGKRLISLDAKTKMAQELVLDKAQADAPTATLPYQIMSEFLIEGWRPPLLGLTSDKIGARREQLTSAAVEAVVLERPIEDKELARVEYWFRPPKADFVEKRFVLRAGGIAKRVVVDQDYAHARTGYAFPRRWRVLDGAGAIASYAELVEIKINEGVPMSAFTQEIPEGYARAAATGEAAR